MAAQAREVATGWEPKLRIALESTAQHSVFFAVLNQFLNEHENLEIDITESVLNGGWDALENDEVDLIVAAPGPVPQQKGFRAVIMPTSEMLPVIAAHHPYAKYADDSEALTRYLPRLRRVITHDTAKVNVTRSAGLSIGKRTLYVQTIDQKLQAQLAGLGIGHLPQHRIQRYLDSGELRLLNMPRSENNNFIAWKLANKGKALQTLSQQLIEANWQPDN